MIEIINEIEQVLSVKLMAVCAILTFVFWVCLYCVKCKQRAIKLTRDFRSGFDRHKQKEQQVSDGFPMC